MKKVLISVGTRPNIIKITQFKKHALSFGVEIKILHTGQHYDHQMAQVFYDQFGVQPDFRQQLEPGSTLSQIAQIMHNVTEVIDTYQPDILLTPGDVNSTYAAAYAAYLAGLPVGHIESGLRSFDRSMPEEINRVLTDELTDQFYVTEKSGLENLALLNKPEQQVHWVGNTMIDTLVAFEDDIDKNRSLDQLQVSGDYALFTFHRPGNVDDAGPLGKLVELLSQTAQRLEVVFPVHPRTVKMLKANQLYQQIAEHDKIRLTDPLDYFAFQKLIKHATLVITDSGGIQEETTFRQIPCLTVRPNTERPITVEIGTNTLLPFDVTAVMSHLDEVLAGRYKSGKIPPLWDGHSTERILQTLR